MSALSTRAEEYLALRRSLGFTLRAEGLLRSFAGFAGEEHLATVTIEAALRWATTPSGTSRSWHAQRLGVVRGFARHLQAIGDCCEVPPPELLAFPKGRAQPYLYSQAEIASLMDAARALVPELRAATYETVIGLLATTGMRVGEAGTPRPGRRRPRRRRWSRSWRQVRPQAAGTAAARHGRSAQLLRPPARRALPRNRKRPASSSPIPAPGSSPQLRAAEVRPAGPRRRAASPLRRGAGRGLHDFRH